MREKCENCKWFAEFEKECRRFPPTLHKPFEDLDTFFPKVRPDEFCGEFTTAKTQEQLRQEAFLDYYKLADEASCYLKDDIMRTNFFREKVLEGYMGIGLRKANKMLAFMKKEGLLLASKKDKGGYWISANEALIDAKNREIDEARA